MDKKIHEKDFLPGQKLPIEILPVHDAWTEMQKKLDDESPAAVVLLQPETTRKSFFQKRIGRASLLLILLLITLFFVNQLNKKDKSITAIATNQKNSTANGKQPGKANSESKEEGFKNSDQEKNLENNKKAIESNISSIENNNRDQKDKKANEIIFRNKNNSKKPGASSKKQKSKKTTSANDVENNDSGKKPSPNNASSEMHVNIQEALIQKNKTDSSAEIKSKVETKKDSSANTTPEPEENVPQYKPILSAGLQWNFQLPVYGADNYFKNSSARPQPYTILLPGAWISMQTEKKSLSAEINPFYSNLLPSRSFGTFTNYSNLPDTIVIISETKTLKKTFGVFISGNYNVNISGNWWAGGGIHAYWLRKGIASSKGTEEKRSISNGGFVSTSFNKAYVLTKPEWENFNRFQLGIHAEIFYSTKKMQAGFRIGLPVADLAKQNGQKTSVRTEMIFRVPLFLLNEIKSPFLSKE